MTQHEFLCMNNDESQRILVLLLFHFLFAHEIIIITTLNIQYVRIRDTKVILKLLISFKYVQYRCLIFV